tara:strand:- start:814 stop:963 length:150 start_codon:yes stop_codon:yes gene_type:complete
MADQNEDEITEQDLVDAVTLIFLEELETAARPAKPCSAVIPVPNGKETK